jgi:ubiquinone/menaquinone biosynthesis C-methylase UbiE
MPDVFARITDAPAEMMEIIANVLETRAAIPQQKEMLDTYLNDIEFPSDSRVLEVGCGTGPVCRVLADIPNVAEVVGVDPSPFLLDKARELTVENSLITYQEADGKSLPFEDSRFDVVILHTLLTHVTDPEQVLSEAKRVLRSGGWLGVCDGDFSTATLAIGELDPLEVCVKAFVEGFVHDRWMVRRMSQLVHEAGFDVAPQRSYGLVETLAPGLTMSWVDRGADLMVNRGTISTDLGAALKAEGRRRAEDRQFFGYMAYASLVAKKINE